MGLGYKFGTDDPAEIPLIWRGYNLSLMPLYADVSSLFADAQPERLELARQMRLHLGRHNDRMLHHCLLLSTW